MYGTLFPVKISRDYHVSIFQLMILRIWRTCEG